MERFDPLREIELSERSSLAQDEERMSGQIALFRRVVQARRRARTRELDLLFSRIDAVLRSA
jgi:hypothetical protein